MRSIATLLLLATLSLVANAKVIWDKSRRFQFELPNSFKEASSKQQTSYSSPDGKVIVTSNLIKNTNKKRLGELFNDYARIQDRGGMLYVRSGSVKLGGSDGMALEVKDKKNNHFVSLASLNNDGFAVIVVQFKPPIVAEPALFSQLVCQSFRWVVK